MLPFRRVVGIGVAVTLLLTNVVATYAVEKSLWEERRTAVERSPRFARLLPSTPGAVPWENQFFGGGSTTSQPPSNFKNLALPFDVASAVLPFGAIGAVHEGRRGAPVVFLVQDVHGNDGAQKNIGGILDGLAAQGITLAGVEGAWGPLDLDAYHRHPSPQAVALVAEALRSSGRLSGAEWAGLTSRRPLTLMGVETPHLYHANVAAARACLARRPVVAEFLRTLTSNLKILKDRVYSHTLKEFDFHRKAYQDSQESLGDFARYLSELPGASNLSGPQVKIFLQAIEWENRLNFYEIEKDRRDLMERLSIELDQRDLNALLARAVDFRAGEATTGDFYSYLKRLCEKRAISLDAYRAFTDYMAFVGLVQTINRGELLNDLASWEFSLGAGLVSSVEEKNLLSIDRDISLLRRLLENEMSPEAWAMYGKRKENIVDLPDRLKGVLEFPEPGGGLVSFIQPHEDFCRLAMERDEALAANLREVVQSKKATAAALVSGGFHTPGLQAQLHKQGWSTIVVTPRIEKIEGKPLDVFARDPLPFDQLFAGKPISLSAELMLGNVSQKKLMGGEMTAEALRLFPVGRSSDDLKEWLEEQGFEVASMARSSNSLARIEVVFQGIEMVLLAGTKDSIDSTEIPDGSERNIISLPNGDYLLSYVDSSSPFPQWRFGYFKKVFDGFYQLFVQWGKKIVPLARGSILNHNHGMRWLSSIFYPIWWVLEMKIVPDGQSTGFPVESRTPNENATMEISSSGLVVRLTLRDRSGNSVGSALAAGKRGDVVLSSVEISPGNNDYSEDLLEGVAKEFLVLKGQGRIRLTGVSDPRVKLAAQRFFEEDTFLVAPNKFGRTSTTDDGIDALGASSLRYSALMNGSDPVNITGFLSLSSRKRFWPNEELPPIEKEDPLPLAPKVEFIPSKDASRIMENQHLGVRENDLYDVQIDGVHVGTCIYSLTPKGVRLRDIYVLETQRRKGYGRAIQVALAKKAALILNPNRNGQGGRVPYEGRNIMNPVAFQIRNQLYRTGTMEVVDVGTRLSDENFEPIENWDHPAIEGTREFSSLVGESNIETHGPNRGKYKRHFNIRGEIIPEIVEAAERELLLEQRENQLTLKSSVQDRPGDGRFEISREGSGVTISMFDSEGRRVGSLVLLGTRGEVTLTGIRIKTKKQEHVNALLLEAARMALFEGGEGRLYIPRVEDENLVRAALSLFDGSTLLVAKSKTGRSKKERNWKDRMDPSDEEGILGLLRSPYQTVDINGELSLKVKNRIWPEERIASLGEEENQRTLLNVQIVKVNDDERDLHHVFYQGEKVGFVIAKVREDVVQILNIKVDEKPVNYRGRGIASIVIDHFAREAARTISPRRNSERINVPLEFRTVENPWIFKHAMEELYEPGSVEIVEVGTDWPLFELTEGSDWATAIGMHHPQFDHLTKDPANINKQGQYNIRFHMRGKLRGSVFVAAKNEIVEQGQRDLHWMGPSDSPSISNGLFFFGVGAPLDPIFASLLVVSLVVAMVYQDLILEWLALKNAPLWLRRGLRAHVPDLSPIRSNLVAQRIRTEINSFLITLVSGTVGVSPQGSFGMLERRFRIIFPGFFLRHYIRPSPEGKENDLFEALDLKNIEDTYAFFARYFGLRGVAVDVGSSSFDGPAKGLQQGGVSKVLLLDHLHGTSSEVSPGIFSFPGDATDLSDSLRNEPVDVVYFHRSLHHIVADKETAASRFGQSLIANGESSVDDPFFHVDILSHVMGEAHQSLKPGGRLLLYFAPHTFRLPGPPAFLGWDLQDMLKEKGFQNVRVWKSAGGTVLVTGLKENISSPTIDDTLSSAERQELLDSLLSISPRPFEAMPPLKEITLESLGGEVDRVTDIPESLSSNVSLARMMRVAQGEKIELYRKIAIYSASLSDDRGKRTAAQAGANAAVFDEAKYPWAQNMDWAFVQNLVSSIVSAGGAVGARLSVFQSAYNSVRSRIWRGRLIGATLASTNGLVLNITPLFEANRGDVGPGVEEALIHLGIALDHEIGSEKPPIELLVDIPLEQQVVEDQLIELIPGWHNLKNSGRLNLRVRGKDGDVFKEEGISLMTLHPELSLTVVGISEKQLVAEEVPSLHERGMTLLPWLEILTKKVEKALKKLVFLRIMA